MTKIRDSKVLKAYWQKYREDFSYAEEISYEDIFGAIEEMAKLIKE